MFVPVVDQNQKPLMPTTPSRARKWIKSGKATGFWKGHVFCVRLNAEPSSKEKQEIAIGVDPGSKKEGFTVKSANHTFLNIQADAITWIKERMETRRNMRKTRRFRKTPCRQPRWNRASLRKEGRIPPSTKARWQWKLNIIKWLKKLFPVVYVVVEDIKAKCKENQRKWNKLFSPLQIGKNWFYSKLESMVEVVLVRGYKTAELRKSLGLKKSSNKLNNDFSAHCVDSWVLANSVVGGHAAPDNTEVMCIQQLKFHKRQLHVMNPIKGGIRKCYGGTMSLGFKRGSLVKHPKHGVVYVGGTSKGRISLYSISGGCRITSAAKLEDCEFLAYNSKRYFYC